MSAVALALDEALDLEQALAAALARIAELEVDVAHLTAELQFRQSADRSNALRSRLDIWPMEARLLNILIESPAEHLVTTEEIEDALGRWIRTPRLSPGSLRTYVGRLRTRLGGYDRFETKAGGLRLTPAGREQVVAVLESAGGGRA